MFKYQCSRSANCCSANSATVCLFPVSGSLAVADSIRQHATLRSITCIIPMYTIQCGVTHRKTSTNQTHQMKSSHISKLSYFVLKIKC